MTPEQQRIALAEWDGWKRPDHPDVMKFKKGWDNPGLWWMCPKGVLRLKHDIPDYPNDLNAVHKLEMKLPKPKLPQDYWSVGYGRFKTILNDITSEPYSATAAQRCEALLKTLNLWTP